MKNERAAAQTRQTVLALCENGYIMLLLLLMAHLMQASFVGAAVAALALLTLRSGGWACGGRGIAWMNAGLSAAAIACLALVTEARPFIPWVLVLLVCFAVLRLGLLGKGKVRVAQILALCAVLLCVPAAVKHLSWIVMVGAAGTAADGLMVYLTMRGEVMPTGEQEARSLLLAASELKKTHAGKRFLSLSCALGIAVGFSLVLLLRLSEQTEVGCILALGAMIGSGLAVNDLRGSWEEKHGAPCDPTNMLLLGCVMWVSGVLMLLGSTLIHAVIGLSLAAAGCMNCVEAVCRLAEVMRDVLRLVDSSAAQDAENAGLVQIRRALMAGLALAAVLLAVCARLKAPYAAAGLTAVLLAVTALAVYTCRFPLSRRWLKKLKLFLERREKGMDEPARRRQIEGRVVQRSHQPILINLVIMLLHVFFHHRVEGAEHIREDEDNPIVYLCNHGDIYGPVASVLFIPTEKRPWTIATICSDVKVAEDYLYKYDWSQIKWLPGPIQHLMAKLLAHISIWGMRSLECVPVWRDSPRQLMQTFRGTVEAMECGDNMLIFPENPNALEQDHGYETSGVGELFSGFAMLAQIYFNKTGKRCRFLPMFAHQASRRIAFGEEIVYDPANDASDERARICREAGEQMNRLAQQLENEYRVQNEA